VSDRNDARRLTLPVVAVITLLVTTATWSWVAARALTRLETKLDNLTVSALNARYVTRPEASKYHRELEHALVDAGLKIRFPPPRDPIDGP
jgi:hypothetical protein